MNRNTVFAVAIAAFLIALLAGLLFFGTGCSSSKNPTGYNSDTNSGSSSSPGANEVWIQGMAFNPSSRTVAVGTTITWTNKDGVAHTVTSGTPGHATTLFDSGGLNGGATFAHTFSQAGTFSYFCRFHSSMTGTIIVQ